MSTLKQIPIILGTGESINTLSFSGNIGIVACSHLKGNVNDRSAVVMCVRRLFDWEIRKIFLSKSIASQRRRIVSKLSLMKRSSKFSSFCVIRFKYNIRFNRINRGRIEL
jgi:hypothetical protein